ncbi:39S ribosomal protein L35, mitochondrial-like [Penaeus japonicus]|uniref:39S ribosomal protein L35, mitochondrial-like n=1 Tax=Penaeus japonicus TaxID=27405 RepID=UPI001C712A34|nr:39S ribosomal protein L35, mitochondrial-like [Penaeus japonicus]XP_042874527.1 39S ribosomal protein L35, mitochondrial-like [Penaeus japonicus]
MLRSVSQLSAACSRAAFTNARLVATNICKSSSQPFNRVNSPLLHQVNQLHTAHLRNGLITQRLSSVFATQPRTPVAVPSLLMPTPTTSASQTRTVVKWSLQKGKRKTVQAVLKRFKRLDWGGRGMWLRPRQGANKKMWKKSPQQKLRSKTHVFCNATQSQMLDKMVCRYWKKTRYYPDDPFRPYLQRDSFKATKSGPREFF